jgi:hypothetical protein
MTLLRRQMRDADLAGNNMEAKSTETHARRSRCRLHKLQLLDLYVVVLQLVHVHRRLRRALPSSSRTAWHCIQPEPTVLSQRASGVSLPAGGPGPPCPRPCPSARSWAARPRPACCCRRRSPTQGLSGNGPPAWTPARTRLQVLRSASTSPGGAVGPARLRAHPELVCVAGHQDVHVQLALQQAQRVRVAPGHHLRTRAPRSPAARRRAGRATARAPSGTGSGLRQRAWCPWQRPTLKPPRVRTCAARPRPVWARAARGCSQQVGTSKPAREELQTGSPLPRTPSPPGTCCPRCQSRRALRAGRRTPSSGSQTPPGDAAARGQRRGCDPT